ncbi:MAG TPA: YciK family oxidoreductase [Gammaproteobacteria bacterium]|nr:YciK family oxidoreductase [Gammaproteobacteria bacterium]
MIDSDTNIPQNYAPSVELLKNRVILVTGASRGIGHAVAKTFAAHGATIILLGRTVKKLEALYDEIVTAGHPTPAIYPFNLANATSKDYEDLQHNIAHHFGQLDGLLHNAAQLGTLTPLEHYPIEQWYQVLQVNLNSAFLLTQATLPLLKRSMDASIVFTTANEGTTGKAYWGAYGVSKFALNGLMQTLADELETNTRIRVNSVNPRQVRTPLRASAYPAENTKDLPLPETILPLYLYLMGSDSQDVRGRTFFTGCDLR